MTAAVLLDLIAAWAILTGGIEIPAAVQLRKHIRNEWVLALAGILSVLIGLLLANPESGALAVVWLIGFYALLFGVLLIFPGYKTRNQSVVVL